MKDGYIRAAAAAPRVEMADCAANAARIRELIAQADAAQAKLLVLPELCLTGYSMGDLFLQRTLLDAAERALREVTESTEGRDMLVVAGLPCRRDAKLFNCAAVMQDGRLLGVVPKQHIPNYSEFYEARHFSSGAGTDGLIRVAGAEVPFGTDLLFRCESSPDFVLGVEICEDLWVPQPPSCRLALEGATVIANLSASPAVAGKSRYRQTIVSAQSGRCICGYVYSSGGAGESSTDLVYSGHKMIAENGKMLGETQREALILADIDTALLMAERRRTTTFGDGYTPGACRSIGFRLRPVTYETLKRPVDPRPFVPAEDSLYRERCREVLDIQCAGLAKRLRHTHAKTAVVAVSGGLDSTLALLVAHRAIRREKLGCRLVAITMPGPGTTGRTRGNAGQLCEALGAEMRVIPIGPAIQVHLQDIGHPGKPDTTFENAQARERTQVAMSVANMTGGLVVGTGDMSELALGFTTYNGDHMSMYGVNAGVPKTLVRHLIRYVAAENGDNARLSDTLTDILDTPVSPELLPPDAGRIAQKTEEILGPYELHDFFLYHFLRFGFPPSKILRLATLAFAGRFDRAFIRKCLREFLRRFFAAQFKRSCLPDGPKVGSVALSPRGDWRMPSDALCREWLRELDESD